MKCDCGEDIAAEDGPKCAYCLRAEMLLEERADLLATGCLLGVYYSEKKRTWQAVFDSEEGLRYTKHGFKTANAAALQHDVYALACDGRWAVLNFPEPEL